MRKYVKVIVCAILVLVLTSGAILAFADENPSVAAGSIIPSDFFAADNVVENKGTVKGDLIGFAQSLLNDGDVEGDIIAFANQMVVNGSAGGSVRVFGNSVSISSQIGRNAMVFGASVVITDETSIKKNAYIFGERISSSGNIEGNTHIFGSNVTLSGTFGGDVFIHSMKEVSSLNILPGTVIKGKLTYEGTTEYHVPSGVQVGEYEYIAVKAAPEKQSAAKGIMPYVRRLLTLVVYYLFALLIYKMFPRFFKNAGTFIGIKPASAAGIGVATFGSLVGGAIFLIILLLITVFVLKVSVFMFAGFVFAAVAIVTSAFAEIPVSMWLGDFLLKKNSNVPARLALGLGLIAAVRFILELAGGISAISWLTGIISFIVNAAIWILGTGAIIKTISEIVRSANAHAEDEEKKLASESVDIYY